MEDRLITEVSISDAPGRLAELLTRACRQGERVFLTQDGRRIAALISITELSLFEDLQVHADLQDALATTTETPPTGGIPLEQVIAELEAKRQSGRTS
jgi:prevent-host-death family protein